MSLYSLVAVELLILPFLLPHPNVLISFTVKSKAFIFLLCTLNSFLAALFLLSERETETHFERTVSAPIRRYLVQFPSLSSGSRALLFLQQHYPCLFCRCFSPYLLLQKIISIMPHALLITTLFLCPFYVIILKSSCSHVLSVFLASSVYLLTNPILPLKPAFC